MFVWHVMLCTLHNIMPVYGGPAMQVDLVCGLRRHDVTLQLHGERELGRNYLNPAQGTATVLQESAFAPDNKL